MCPSPRSVVVLAPLFCLRRDSDTGIGDTAALKEFIDWASDCGIDTVQLLPIHATGSDPSPYNAISSVALDPLTLEVSPQALPELTAHDLAHAREPHAGVMDSGVVHYAAVRDAKLALLRLAWDRFCEEAREGGRSARKRASIARRREDFEAFCESESDWLTDFAQFVMLTAEAGTDHPDRWPAGFNTAARARGHLAKRRRREGPRFDRELRFIMWQQWLAHTQWRAVRAHADARGVRLMGDMPIGVSYQSADVFFEPQWFRLDWSGGSPAEPAYKDNAFTQRWGQNWGVPLYDWDALAHDGARWWQRRVRKLTQIFHVFRIDHVLGLYRQYAFPWRPARDDEFLRLSPDEASERCGGNRPRFFPNDDDTEDHRQANLAHGDRWLRTVIAAAGGAEVVAEDLGTVPHYVRPHLASLGVPGFKIPQWEDDPVFPACSFAAFTTHDLPPLAMLWNSLGTRCRSDDEKERGSAWTEWHRIARLAGMDSRDAPPPWSDDHKWTLIGALLRCPSKLAGVMITDVLGLTMRFNTPGTAGPHNWTARLPCTGAGIAHR